MTNRGQRRPGTEDVAPADAADAISLAEEAEAEAAEAEAVAAAARARARAIRLRRQAQASKPEAPDAAAAESEVTDAEATVAQQADAEPACGRLLRPWRWKARIPGWKALVASLAVICTIGLFAAGGWMIWTHRQQDAYHQREVQFAAAARQGVVTLMSLDFKHAKEDVQRIIDNTTGQFKQDFQNSADAFTKVAEDSKVITEVTVNDSAVESITGDSAVVLVSATSRVTNAAGANQEPRSWRLSVTMQRDGGQLKMSRVEFVP
jgi:Mce-associated membrane protein